MDRCTGLAFLVTSFYQRNQPGYVPLNPTYDGSHSCQVTDELAAGMQAESTSLCSIVVQCNVC